MENKILTKQQPLIELLNVQMNLNINLKWQLNYV